MNPDCPACQHPVTSDLQYVQSQVPVQSVCLVPNRQSALDFPRGDIVLLQCEWCGLVFNLEFDPATQHWDERYEETQAFSAHFNSFAARLAELLVNRWDLYNKRILELGCGKGHFLAELCRDGRNQGLGIDPAFVPARNPAEHPSVRYISDVFKPDHMEFDPNLIVCRHTLEHLADPGILLSALADRPGIPVFIDVPNLELIAREGAFWDIYYEHCNYFDERSLLALLRRFNIACDEIARGFDEQYLMAFGSTVAGNVTSLAAETRETPQPGFSAKLTELAQAWARQILHWHQQGKIILLWGGGSKAVGFLSGIGSEAAAEIAGVVDINPHKQGLYLPGSAHRVYAPAELAQSPPDCVVILNPAYREEIEKLFLQLEISCQLVDVNSILPREPIL